MIGSETGITRLLTLSLAVFIALVAYGWTGYLASDDAIYAAGAYGWLREFPYVGGHGTIRYTITIPIALSFLTFGEQEFSLALPALLYTLGLIGILVAITHRNTGSTAALILAGLLATNPILVTWASIASVDIIEAFFLFLSLTFFYRSVTQGATAGRLLLTGAFAALAFLTRETTVFFVAFIGVLFLFGYGIDRWRYFIIGAGFLAVWLAEVLYLFVMTGDPLYRLNISLHHGGGKIDRGIDLAGNVIIHPIVDPLLVILANQEFVFLFWIAIPLGIWMAFRKAVSPAVRHAVIVFGGVGLFWFLCAGAAHDLLPLNPRYFLITALGATVVTALALAELLRNQSQRLVFVALFLLIGGNIAGIYVENRNSLFGEKALAEITQRYPGALYTDPMTRYRADLLLTWKEAAERVSGDAPPPGSVYVYNATRANRPNKFMPKDEMGAYQPQGDWKPLEEVRPSSKIAGRLLKLAGLEDRIPKKLMNVLSEGHSGIVIYQIPSR